MTPPTMRRGKAPDVRDRKGDAGRVKPEKTGRALNREATEGDIALTVPARIRTNWARVRVDARRQKEEKNQKKIKIKEKPVKNRSYTEMTGNCRVARRKNRKTVETGVRKHCDPRVPGELEPFRPPRRVGPHHREEAAPIGAELRGRTTA